MMRNDEVFEALGEVLHRTARYYRPRMPASGDEKAFTVSHISAQLFRMQMPTITAITAMTGKAKIHRASISMKPNRTSLVCPSEYRYSTCAKCSREQRAERQQDEDEDCQRNANHYPDFAIHLGSSPVVEGGIPTLGVSPSQ